MMCCYSGFHFLFLVILISRTSSGNSEDLADDYATENSGLMLMPPMPPRIYAKAPSKVLVTQVKLNRTLTGIHRGADASCLPKYFLHRNSDTDHEHFSVSLCTGTISTARAIDKSIGDAYEVIVVAKDERNKTLASKMIQIEVTSYNSIPPLLSRKHYSSEVLDTSSEGTLILTLIASDNDTDPVNREFRYALKDESNERTNPWLYPLKKPIVVNSTTGDIRVSEPLSSYSSPLQFKVLVSDSGSPIRIDQSVLTLHIRNISAPRNVRIFNTTKSSIKVCWSEPLHGTPEGYLVSYTARGPIGSFPGLDDKGNLNLTIDQLETRKNDPPLHFQMMTDGFSDEDETEQARLDEVQEELYNFFAHQFCTTVEHLHPLTNYAISVRAWAHPNRISMARLPLTVITRRQNCNDVSCNHGVCQEKNASPGYRCICRSGYSGRHCDRADPCIKGPTCLNGGRCISTSENDYKCHCLFGFIGDRCQKINRCLVQRNPCVNGGTCATTDRGGSVECHCPPNFSGIKCEIELEPAEAKTEPLHCEAETTTTAEGEIRWPKTPEGETASLDCPYGAHDYEFELQSTSETTKTVYDTFTNQSEASPLKRSTRSTAPMVGEEIDLHVRSIRSIYKASRTCKPVKDEMPRWLPPNLGNCRTKEVEIEEVLNMTSVENLNSSLLQSSVKKIAHLVDKALHNKKIAQNMVSAISNILNANDEVFEDLLQTTNTTQSILSTIHEYTSKVPLRLGEKIKLRAKNLVLEAKLFHKKDLPEQIEFNPYAKGETQFPHENEIDQEKLIDHKKLWFRMPKSSLLEATKLHQKTDHIRFQFLYLNNDRLFLRNKRNTKFHHPVITASVADITVRDLQTPIKYMVPVRKFDPSMALPMCVFWDLDKHEWSRTGVETFQNENGEIFCESNHLTSFSVLLDPVGTPVMEDIKPFLSVITYIGITLSTIALIATIATFALFSFNRDKSGLIVMNLSIALLIMNISFLASLFISTDQSGCCFVGALLHYAVTASFAWMLIEAINMYQLLVTVFPSSETHFMRKRVLIGWVSPLVLVITALIWNKKVYFTEYQSICVISPLNAPGVYYTTYLAPLCIVLFINIGVFVMVAKVLCQSRPTYKRKVPVTLAQIRGAIAIVALLGITWLTGIFAVGHLRVVSQVLFCLTTPFQGMIIFWVRVLQSSDAKSAWRTFLKTGSTRKRPQIVSSQRTHSSSHQASSFHTQSTGASPNTKSVYESALNTVRRLSSSGFGLIGSAKKFRSSTSSDSSTKKLKKKMSGDSEKQKKTLVNESKPPADNTNIQTNLTSHNMDHVCHLLTNGNQKDCSEVIFQTKLKKEYLSSSDTTEKEPLKDLYQLLDFNINNEARIKRDIVDSLNGTAYQEYIYNYLNISKIDKACLLYDSPKKISYSATNLSPTKIPSCLNKDDFARSLESLLPSLGSDFIKTKSQHYESSGEGDSTKKIEKGSLSSNRTSSSYQDMTKLYDLPNGSCDDSVTKSASESDITSEYTTPTGKMLPEWNVPSKNEPSQLDHENESSTRSLKNTKKEKEEEEEIKQNAEEIHFPKTGGQNCFSRRSSSTSNLDCGDQGFLYSKYSAQSLV